MDTDTPDSSMRVEHNGEHKSQHSTNGSSQNGSSPHTNGSAAKTNSAGTDTNGHNPEAYAVAVPHNSAPFFGHDREEVTRILLQSLSDLGYNQAAQQLASESGYEQEVPSAAAFKNAMLQGHWEEAETLLLGPEEMDGGVMLGNGHSRGQSWSDNRPAGPGGQNGFARHGLPLMENADTTLLKFLLRQQKYLELLERRQLNTALSVLRNELTPLKRDIGRIHVLSGLMMCQSAEDVRSQAAWDGAQGESRQLLLSEVSKSISPSVMIPEHRLAALFTEVQDQQVFGCQYHNTDAQPSLYTDHECSSDDFPLHTLTELTNHSDEVWHVEFSHDGSMLATAGKDGLVCIYDTVRWKVKHEFREHERPATGSVERGVCYVAFSPDDQHIISCSLNNEFVVMNVQTGRRAATGDHFDYPVTTAAWLPDSQSFVVGTQSSRRPLGLYSLRKDNSSTSSSVSRNNEIYSWRSPSWDSNLKDQPPSFRITDCAVDPSGTRLVATTIDKTILMYDLDSRQKLAEWQMEDKLTSINFSADGQEMLVNMNTGRVLSICAETGEVLMRYVGARQREYVVRSCFGGAGEGVVVSGSEGIVLIHSMIFATLLSHKRLACDGVLIIIALTDSRVHIWRRQTGLQVVALDAHAPGAVNAVAWHPTNPALFASAGDDRKVRM